MERHVFGIEINPEEVTEIQCTVYPRCLEIGAIAEPKTGLEGKFSAMYCLALALQKGKVLLDSFNVNPFHYLSILINFRTLNLSQWLSLTAGIEGEIGFGMTIVVYPSTVRDF